MMNQGSNTVSELDSKSGDKYQVADAIQVNLPGYSSYNVGHTQHSTIGSNSSTWSLQGTDNRSTENGIPSGSGYDHHPYNNGTAESTTSNGAQVPADTSSYLTSSSSLGASGSHEYATYTSYAATSHPYGYNSVGNQGQQSYYYAYQDQATNHSYSQQPGAYQTSGAPYQTYTSSFQSTGSYVGPSSYSGSHYNAGADYQTNGGGYQSSNYSDQTNMWNGGNYGHYHHHYSSYAPDSNSLHYPGASAAMTSSVHYQQHYKQWADYYSQSSSDVSCAPGTENVPVTTTTTLSVQCPIPGISGGYPDSSSQPPPPGTTSWRPDNRSSELPSMQVASVDDGHDSTWKSMSPGFSHNHLNHLASYAQKPPELNQLHYDNLKSQHSTSGYPSQTPTLEYSAGYQTHLQNYQPPSQSANPPLVDALRINKLQIPTNPRIASPLVLGISKVDKDGCTASTSLKPAYVSVSVPKTSTNISTSEAPPNPLLKQGAFPSSLRAYVERALARCKDDSQKVACQNIMKEIITKASADGTLFTKNWDVEPLFPLPVRDSEKDKVMSFSLSSLSTFKRSPSRRTKSRWEPLPEEKLAEKLASVNYDPIKDVGWDYSKQREGLIDGGKSVSKEDVGNHIKLFPSQPSNYTSKNTQRLVKKPRFGDAVTASMENGDVSSDSDKEQGLTSYYAAAINLANSPEEKKKRENRFKRFEGRDVKPSRSKGVGAGNLYSRRASALFTSKNLEEGQNRAVEDMDWDSLTVKGTCQEIEKRYLRLTSAPDPATVRPEDVLEKALEMVQTTNKNYLYKCDQLKSIRQDLTVQRIRNELTVKVYETHARLALEAGDLPEYNQCQSQLKSLYSEGIKGCHMEFSAYNMLCVILHSNNKRDLVSSMARLSLEARNDEAVKHALAVRTAVVSGNYVLFFRLYKSAPNLNTLLMDLYVEKMRFEAVKCMSRSYRPTVPVAFIAQVLSFPNGSTVEGSDEKEMSGVEECEEWLRAHGASIIFDNTGEMQLDTKASSSTLYIPEPEDAVAHGDANLAVNDFLTRTS